MRLKNCLLLLGLLLPISLFADRPISEDRGSVGLAQSLRKLQTTGRVAYIMAHPDDEEGGAVTMLARGKGYQVTILMLSRGEAAGDVLSSDFGDFLGVRRTIEMVKSAEYYGARLRVARFRDFGLSKSLSRTLRHWDKEEALGDMVRFIRQERPHVIIARWQGTPRDGLGNHEAAGVIAQLAFEAAGDPSRFPEQIENGLKPWKPLKLYSDNWRAEEKWTLAVHSETY